MFTRFQDYYRKNREKRKAESLVYNKLHQYQSQKKYNKTYWKRTRLSIFDILGKKCVRCGFEDMRALQIDHVNGGGAREQRKYKGAYIYHLRKDVRVNPSSYQILCANCNWIKKSENNEVKT